MSKESLKAILKNPYNIFQSLGYHNLLNWLPDEIYLKLLWKAKFDTPLNLKNPQTFNEKLQWLKLYNRKPEYTQMVDKYLVRDYIKEKIGEEYLIPLLGVWDKAEEIDFDSLPNQFVLKCNHDSGSVIICKDKAKFDKNTAIKKLNTRLKIGTYWPLREWPYKDVPRKVIAEQYMEDPEIGELRDYKIYTFNGKAEMMFIATDRAKGKTKADYFDRDFNHLNFTWGYPHAEKLPEKPKNFEKMFDLAEILAQGTPELRVDFYEVDGKIYFGELTFFDGSGFAKFEPEEWDYTFGSWVTLPPKTANNIL